MTFFYALPIAIVACLVADFVLQRAFRHFVDTSSASGIVLGVTCAWALVGWHEETHVNVVLAANVTECQVVLAGRQADLNQFLRDAIYRGGSVDVE